MKSNLLYLPLMLLLTAPLACGDSGSTDAGTDTGVQTDTGSTDSGATDSGTTDTGPSDTGSNDASTDAGAGDMGPTDTGTTAGPFDRLSCADVTGPCLEFLVAERDEFLDAINDPNLQDGTTLILARGTFIFDNAVTFRNSDDLTLTGQGIDQTILDFATQPVQTNGVDVVGDGFSITDLTLIDAKKDALRIEDSRDVTIQRIKTTWTNESDSNNGSYGIYPVRCVNVLVEDSEAWNSADAGIYVGQSINAIIRNNIVKQNVAGLEIENTQYADVYGNLAEDNTAGIVVFDLPGNPVIGRDVKVHDNVIIDNNRPNFASTAGSVTTVSQIPAGTGTFALASRRVEIADNTYERNDTVDIAILSGLIIQDSTTAWAIDKNELPVDSSTAGLELVDTGTHLLNFRTTEVWIHGNTHTGSGTSPDGGDQDARPLGTLLTVLYFASGFGGPVDTVVYDGVDETVDPAVAGNNTNNNHLCVQNVANGTATYATLDIPKLIGILDGGNFPAISDIYRPATPFTPFDCTGFTNGPIPPITLP